MPNQILIQPAVRRVAKKRYLGGQLQVLLQVLRLAISAPAGAAAAALLLVLLLLLRLVQLLVLLDEDYYWKLWHCSQAGVSTST